MDALKLLIQGYARQKPDGKWDAASATVLVNSSGKRVLIDPGADPSLLTDAMGKEGLIPEDIDMVLVTHSHRDHSGNLRLFDKTKVHDLSHLFRTRKGSRGLELVPDTDIEIILTPGHVDKHVSFLVDTVRGKCAVAGDVFWWEDGQEPEADIHSLINHPDPAAKDTGLLEKSRLKLIDSADIIIPGHGREFAVPPGLNQISNRLENEQ